MVVLSFKLTVKIVDSDIKRRLVFPAVGLVMATILALSVAEVSLRVLEIGYGNAPLESDSVLRRPI